MYKHADLRPWDPRNDVYQYEYNYVIQTKTRHQTPMIRTASIVSVDPQTVVSFTVLFSSLQQCSPKDYIEYSKGLFFFNHWTVHFDIYIVRSPTNALFIKLDKVLKFTLKITLACSYMFRSTTLIREPSLEPS